MVQFILDNGGALISVLSMALAIGVAIAHMAHKDAVASSLQNVEDAIDKLKAAPKK